MRLSFFVPGEPKGKGRPRTAVRGGHATIYTDKQTVTYENLVKVLCYEAMQKEGIKQLAGSLTLKLMAYMPIPASTSKRKHAAMVGEPHTKKPDADNIIKAVLDGLNGVAFKDDSMVYCIVASKTYQEDAEVGVIVTVED